LEWGRVKTILILSFLFLNLLLGYQLWESRLGLLSLVPNETAEEVAGLLRNKGIELMQEIPKETPNVREISIEYKVQMGNGERETLPESIPLGPTEERWRNRLKETIPELDSYAADDILSTDQRLVLNQVINGFPMFQIQLHLYLRDQRIVSYSRNFVEVQAFQDQKEQQTALSAYRVMRLLAETKLKSGAVIEGIELGYHGQLFNSDTQVLAPKWRVTMQNGDVYYVHAISGEVE
jgi:regulatory protein YycI of two-component signal transduction system YycFG